MKERFKKKLVRVDMERRGDEKLAKISEIRCPESGGEKRRGRLRMRWEDYCGRDLGEWEENGEQQQKIGVEDW